MIIFNFYLKNINSRFKHIVFYLVSHHLLVEKYQVKDEKYQVRLENYQLQHEKYHLKLENYHVKLEKYQLLPGK